MRWWSTATALVLLLGGCGGDDPVTPTPTDGDADDDAFAVDGTDTNAAESDVQLVASSLISSSTAGEIGLELGRPDMGTADDGVGEVAIYLPRRCATVQRDPAKKTTVTYTFAGCLGPAGLRNVTGEVTATYRIEQKVLSLDITFANLAVNEATVSGTASADVTPDGATRTMRWDASITGTTARGRTFTRKRRSTIIWTVGDACYTLDGASEGDVKNETIKVEVTGFRRCRRGCPDAGGKVSITKVSKNRTITLAYDGSNRATFTNAKGIARTVALLCRP